MKAGLFIASRLKLSKKGSQRSAASIKIATAGVALSIAIMLITVAVVSGFKQQITEKIIGFDAQLTVSSVDGNFGEDKPIRISKELSEEISAALPGANIDIAFLQPAMLKTEDNFSAVVLRAYGSGKDYSFLNENIITGTVTDFNSPEHGNTIAISKVTADELGLKTSDKVNICFFIDNKLRVRKMTIGAIYSSNFSEYDRTIAYCAITTLQKLRGLSPDEGTRIEISGLGQNDLPAAQKKLQNKLSDMYYSGMTDSYLSVSSVLDSGAVYFNWLDLLDTNVAVIIILMSAISVFTLISSLFILILERVQLIGTLKTIGATNSLIRRIFIALASKIVLRGIIAGNIAGLSIILVQYFSRVLPLDPEAYYISFVPVRIGVPEVLLLNTCAIAISLAVMVIPSGIISKMSPAKIVRFE